MKGQADIQPPHAFQNRQAGVDRTARVVFVRPAVTPPPSVKGERIWRARGGSGVQGSEASGEPEDEED